MKKALFTGSCVALVTPFTEDGVNWDKLESLIEWHIAQGTDAILTCGPTGESSTMPDEEHMAVMKFTIEKIAGRVHVMANTGSNDTRHAIQLTQYAESIGADSILSVTPYYNKTTQEGVFRHFSAIAQSVNLPVVLYNIPSRTNLNIDPDTLIRLSEVDNIAGVKECNLCQMPEVLAHTDRLTFWSGEDGLVIPSLAMGGQGVISVMANLIPRDTSDMVHAWLNGEHEKALAMQLRMIPLVKALFSETSPIPIKEAMNLAGLCVGACRMPLVERSDKGRLQLVQAMKAYGVVTA
jgi:4-hydroxy-tetrahydrodipicolinate synthase